MICRVGWQKIREEMKLFSKIKIEVKLILKVFELMNLMVSSLGLKLSYGISQEMATISLSSLYIGYK